MVGHTLWVSNSAQWHYHWDHPIKSQGKYIKGVKNDYTTSTVVTEKQIWSRNFPITLRKTVCILGFFLSCDK